MAGFERGNIIVKASAGKHQFVRKSIQHFISNENALRYVGLHPDLTPDELWPEEEPLSLDETLIALRLNRLKRMYIDNEMYEIMECSVLKRKQNEKSYWEFVELLTESMELLGQGYVNDILEPLGFSQKNYCVTKRVR
jgi:hypothetical protein